MARMREILLPWDSQPQEAVRINFDNPLSRDLVIAFHPMWSREILYGITGTITGGTLEAGVGGNGYAPLTSSSRVQFSEYSRHNILTDLTCLAVATSTSTSGDKILANKGQTNGANNTPFNFGSNDGGNIYINRANASGLRIWKSTTTPILTNGELNIFSVSQATGINTTPDFYYGGVSQGATAQFGSGSGAATAGGSGLRIGTRADSSRNWPGNIFLFLAWDRVLDAREHAEISSNPWQICEPQTIWVPVSAGGGGPTTAAITAAAGASAASALTGSATATATTTQAAGTSTASMAGSSVAAAAITQASGVATASTIAGGLTAVGAITQADGVATASIMAASAGAVSAFSAAPGAATGETLTGSGLTAGASSITPASGASTASSLAGSSTAAAAISPAAGAATASTISASVGVNIVSASMVPSAGVATASEFAASAVAATVAIASAGASSAQAMAATAQAVADFVAAAGVATAETMVDFDSSVPVLGSLVGSTRKVGMGRPASVSSIARTSRQPLIR